MKFCKCRCFLEWEGRNGMDRRVREADTYWFILHFSVLQRASFLKPQEPTSSSFQLFFCRFLTLSGFTELKRVGALFWMRLWLQGIWWPVWSSTPTTKSFSVSAIRMSCLLIIHVFTRVALLISFKIFSFAFTTWPTGASGLAFSLSWLSTSFPP